MTVSSTALANSYIGTGITGPFAYNFRIFAATDLIVEKTTDGLLTTRLAYPADYTVTGVGNVSGGSVTLTAALATNQTLVIRRERPLTQTTNFRDQQRYSPTAVENAIDNLTMVTQQLDDTLDRVPRIPYRLDKTLYSMEVTPVANQVLAWRGDGLGLESRSIDSTAVVLPGDSRTVATLSNYLSNNKVFCPLDYGAVGDGTTNDGPAIRNCMVAARAWANAGTESISHKLPVIDFRGRRYATAIQVEIPGGQGMKIQNGVICPAVGFTAGMYLMHIGSTGDTTMTDGFKNVNSTIRDIIFDNRSSASVRVGGGLFVEKFMRLCVDRCLFAHYTTVGLKTGVNDSHEMFLTNCQFGEYWWGETDGVSYLNPDLFVGTGIEINAADNHLSNIVIQLSKYGLKVTAQANNFNKIHIWTGYVKAGVAGPTATLTYLSTGLWITASGTLNTFDQMYMDGCEVLWETPWKTSFTNSIFLNGWGDATRAMIRFKPMAASQFVLGVVITGCSFQVQNGGLMLMTSVDTSAGTFNSGQVTNCRIQDNNSTGVTLQYTTVKMSISQSAANTWTFDLSGMLAFGNTIQQCMYSVYYWGGGTQLFRLTSIAGAIATIGSYAVATPGTLSANNATVAIEATINRTN